MRPKKHLGQNFLTSQAAVKAIIDAGEVRAGDTVLEIGPGRGILTAELLSRSARVVAVEKDNDLIPKLLEGFGDKISLTQLTLIQKDIRDFDHTAYFHDTPFKLISNIPYYITGELLERFLQSKIQPTVIVFLLQKEVAERIVARDKKESVLSVSVKVYGTPKLIRIVKRGSFSPSPNVDSAILSISKISKNAFAHEEDASFFHFLHVGFAHKRKFLVKNLTSLPLPEETILEVFSELALSPKIRPEDVSAPQWIALFRKLSGKPTPHP